MTAQVGDSFKYKKSGYGIVAISEPIEFDPKQYGITPQHCCTACWKGYWCDYEISKDGIVLNNLYINSKDSNYPEINGVQALLSYNEEREMFLYMGHHLYKGLNIKIPYTGKIVVGKDFIPSYYVHMGYQQPWAYKKLKEFVFEDGALVKVINHSGIARKMRRQIKKDPNFMDQLHQNKKAYINNAFSLDFAAKAWWIK